MSHKHNHCDIYDQFYCRLILAKINSHVDLYFKVYFRKQTYELLTIIIVEGAPYLKCDRDILGNTFVLNEPSSLRMIVTSSVKSNPEYII